MDNNTIDYLGEHITKTSYGKYLWANQRDTLEGIKRRIAKLKSNKIEIRDLQKQIAYLENENNILLGYWS